MSQNSCEDIVVIHAVMWELHMFPVLTAHASATARASATVHAVIALSSMQHAKQYAVCIPAKGFKTGGAGLSRGSCRAL